MSQKAMRAGCQRSAINKAFTLIEVLVVVAIIALLISILLPSLKQAREISKMMVCLSHLKEQGNAMQMYMVDSKDCLPGPLHPLFLAYPQDMTYAGYTESQNKYIMSGYLNTKLRKYFGESTFGKGGTAKEVGSCPAFPIDDDTFKGSGGASPIYHYALNNSKLTAPQYYFGFTHGGIKSQAEWNTSYGGNLSKWAPKKLSRVLSGRINAAAEWMIADAFRRPLPKRDPWPTENEPGYEVFPSPNPDTQWKEWGSLAPDLQEDRASASGKVAPYHPFHLKGGFRQVSLAGGTTTVFYGKVNTLYFDMHAETQDGWKGTIMPWARVENRSR